MYGINLINFAKLTTKKHRKTTHETQTVSQRLILISSGNNNSQGQ